MARRKRKLRILIAGNAEKVGVRPAARDLAGLIDKHPDVSCAGIDLSRNKKIKSLRADIILALGGDGTVLNLCRRMGASQKPVLGIRFGHKGFLAEVLPEEMEAAVKRIAAGQFSVSERLRIEADVLRAKRKPETLVALNEVTIHTGTIARVVDLNVRVDGEQVLAYDGDGIIVATPTGSTAYSLAAGGPIVAPEVMGMVITPVSPHTLAARPLVVAPESVIEVDVIIRQHTAALTADGQQVLDLHNGNRVRVRRHRQPFKLIELGTRDRYQPVRDNLGWIP